MKANSPHHPQFIWFLGIICLAAMVSASRCYDTTELKPEGNNEGEDDNVTSSCAPSYGSEWRLTASDFDGVDVLLVIDNSSSMTEEQAILSTSLYQLVNLFTQPLVSRPDWPYPAVPNVRVAVVTSDMGLQWGDGQVSAPTVPVSGCSDRGDDGAFQTLAPDVLRINIQDGVIVCDPDEEQCPDGFSCENNYCTSGDGFGAVSCEGIDGNYAQVASEEPNPSLALQVACLAQQGSSGCGVEQQLEAGVRGLAEHPKFLHPTHLLAVLVVSDEEDCSIESNELFNTPEWLSGTSGDGLLNIACNYPEENNDYLFDPLSYYDRLVALKDGQAASVVFGAIVGVPNDGNNVCQGDGEALAASSCLADSRMSISVGTFVDPASGATYQHFNPACTREENGVTVTSARPGRRYVEVAEQFGDAGYVYSICNADWTPAVNTIYAKVARQIAPACFPERLDWTPLGKDEQDTLDCPDCGVSECDLFAEIVRTGDAMADETCPAAFYDRISPEEKTELLKRKLIETETQNGELVRKIIACPLPKLPTSLDCDDADMAISERADDIGWYYCEKTGENFDDACSDAEDNDDDGAVDCDDIECAGCAVCGESGSISCEDGCRYSVQITDRAKREATGHFLTVKCNPVAPKSSACE